MAYYTTEQIEKAREMDLLTYLQNFEPYELVHVGGNIYCTREHDSLKISNGKWMWWSRGFGGASALDYLIKVRGEPFTKAMEMILRQEAATRPPISMSEPSITKAKKLLLPDKCPTNDIITEYLISRGIDLDIINYCIKERIIYESLPYHNCIFLGYDEAGRTKYACFRATKQEKIMGEAAGSDKAYSFRIDCAGSTIRVFESAIDLLSFATKMNHITGEWRAESMLSLGGVYVSHSEPEKAKLPSGLEKKLNDDNSIKTIVLHLDNDFAGREASEMIRMKLDNRYEIRNEPPNYGKDMNDELQHFLRKERGKDKNYVR